MKGSSIVGNWIYLIRSGSNCRFQNFQFLGKFNDKSDSENDFWPLKDTKASKLPENVLMLKKRVCNLLFEKDENNRKK